MKLYQGLTQVQVNEEMADDAPDFKITTDLVKPLHYAPSELYHYLDAVLKPGSRHDQNNLKYVTDAAFIGENFDFNSSRFDWHSPIVKNNPKNTATRSHETPIRLRYFLID